MSIRQSSPRTDRRRRVLVDDRYAASSTGPQLSVIRDESRPTRRYSSAADLDRQWRFCDVIPRRRWTLLVWMLSLACLQVTLALLHSSYHLHAPHNGPIDLTSFDFGKSGGVLTTVTGFSCLVATIYSCLVLSFRRHKIDDYRGTYRIWYSVTTGLGCVAVVLLSGLQPLLRSATHYVLAAGESRHAATWSLVVMALVGVYYEVRLLLEIRVSRGATLGVCCAGLFAALACLARFRGISFPAEEIRQLVSGLCQLAACHALLLSILLYASHVLRDTLGEAHVEEEELASPVRGRWQPRLASLPRLRWPRLPRLRRAKTETDGPDNIETSDKKVSKRIGGRKAAEVTDAGGETSTVDASPVAGTTEDQNRRSGKAPPSRAERPVESTTTHLTTSVDDHEVDTDDDNDMNDMNESSDVSHLGRTDRKRLRKEQRRHRKAA